MAVRLFSNHSEKRLQRERDTIGCSKNSDVINADCAKASESGTMFLLPLNNNSVLFQIDFCDIIKSCVKF